MSVRIGNRDWNFKLIRGRQFKDAGDGPCEYIALIDSARSEVRITDTLDPAGRFDAAVKASLMIDAAERRAAARLATDPASLLAAFGIPALPPAPRPDHPRE